MTFWAIFLQVPHCCVDVRGKESAHRKASLEIPGFRIWALAQNFRSIHAQPVLLWWSKEQGLVVLMPRQFCTFSRVVSLPVSPKTAVIQRLAMFVRSTDDRQEPLSVCHICTEKEIFWRHCCLPVTAVTQKHFDACAWLTFKSAWKKLISFFTNAEKVNAMTETRERCH